MDGLQAFNFMLSAALVTGALVGLFIRIAYRDVLANQDPAALALVTILLLSMVGLITASGVTHNGDVFRITAGITRGMALMAEWTLVLTYVHIIHETKRVAR